MNRKRRHHLLYFTRIAASRAGKTDVTT